MTDEEIRDELLTALVAGHETTASSLAWAFEQLARAPEVQERLRASSTRRRRRYLDGDDQRGPAPRPVLPNAEPRLVKQADRDRRLDLPAGRRADRQRLPRAPRPGDLPRALRLPARALPRTGKPGTYTWIPFGGGRRRCLGASFALLEMRIVLRAAAERFTVAAAGPPPRHAAADDHDHAGRRRARAARRGGPAACTPAEGQILNVSANPVGFDEKGQVARFAALALVAPGCTAQISSRDLQGGTAGAHASQARRLLGRSGRRCHRRLQDRAGALGLLEGHRLRDDSAVVDVGAGTSDLSKMVAEMGGESRIICVDYDEGIVEAQRAAETDPAVEWRTADALEPVLRHRPRRRGHVLRHLA